MQPYFFNTLSRKKEKFIPIKPGKVEFYACGPTVYNFAHIGNLRTYIFEDILRRVLEAANFKVNHVMNVTDVGHLQSDADEGDDKMALAAKKEQKSPWEIAQAYETAFFDDFKKLHLQKPTLICRATEHIEEMQKHILGLVEKGLAYEVDGNIYFRIAKFPDYNKLSRRNLEELQEGVRIEVDPRKEDPLDFVLWFSKSKFPNQIMRWNSPWGEGFPGWHIECSAMASKYLGEHIDIHAGGIDHISVHHTNEIAQAEGYFGHKWVNYWLHGEFLVLVKEKMAKSKGNFLTLKTLTDKYFDPLHCKDFCFSSHYRSQLLFSFEALSGAKNAFESLKNRVISFKLNPDKKHNEVKENEYSRRFFTAMLDDLDSPVALSIIWEMLKDGSLGRTQKLDLMKKFDTILGFDIDSFSRPSLSAELSSLVEKREQARKSKDWALADEIRDKLAEEGILIKDLSVGTDWYFAYLVA